MDGPVATFKEENEVLYHNLLKNSSIKTKTQNNTSRCSCFMAWTETRFFLKQQQQQKNIFFTQNLQIELIKQSRIIKQQI